MEEYDRIDVGLYGSGFYDYYGTGLEGDAQFYVEEAQKTGSPVLEIGCGTGRITIPIAEAGVDIVGLDRSSNMLSIFRQKIANLNAETQSHIRIVKDDMRSFSLKDRFKLIIIPYRAFLHLLTPEDQRLALNQIHRHLTDDGLLIFNIFDPSLEYIVAHLGRLGSALKKDSEFIHLDTGHTFVVWNSLNYDPGCQILKAHIIFEELDDDGKVISKTYCPSTLRYVYRYEMQYLLELCGYRIEALYGDFQRGPFHHGEEQIWVARKMN